MLSPDGDHGGKQNAPSIWSFDSGYGTQEEGARNGAFYQHASTSENSLLGRMDDGLGLGIAAFSNFHIGEPSRSKMEEVEIGAATQLQVFTAKDVDCDDFFLPEISADTNACMTCDIYNIANPGGNLQCEDCRLPAIIDPSMLYSNGLSGGKEPIRSFENDRSARTLAPYPGQMLMQARCSACELSHLIDPVAPISCSSCSPNTPDLLSPMSPSTSSSSHRIKRSRAGRTSKLPLSALNKLQSWLDTHVDNPYPSAAEKRQLAQDCDITEKQVTTWFTNARARQLSPLDTWLSSGSDEDAAKEEDIERASAEALPATGFTYLSDVRSTGPRRAASIADSSAPSTNQRTQPSRRGKKKNYRRNAQTPQLSPIASTPAHSSTAGEQETWQCTFCRQHLAPKSWRRHEETQHHTCAQWTCMLHGPRLTQTTTSLYSRPNTSSSCCAFCMLKDPSEDHFLTHHRISECSKRPIGDRTFYRPDHLRQHVKNFHGAKLFDVAQARWKKEGDKPKRSESWICGFCGERLNTWRVREAHIANHFKEGRTMDSWVDYTESPELEPSRGKSRKDSKEKEKDHPHGLARLSRTFTRRSTRSSQKTITQETSFANAFDAIPASQPMVMDYGFSHSQAPVLPEINTDLLMGGGGYGGFDDWGSMNQVQTQVSAPQYATHLSFDPNVQMDFDLALNREFEYGNGMEYPGPWNQQS